LATLGFGFYLTRFADYSVVYGPLGAVVATLVWLYISTVSVLIGAEFNAHIFPKPQRMLRQVVPAEEEKMVAAGGKRPPTEH
jgi:membrane protein